VKKDISNAAKSLPEDAWNCDNPGARELHRGSFLCGSPCTKHENDWDKRGCWLCRFWYLVDSAITELKNFKKAIEDFRQAVRDLRDSYEALQCGPRLTGNQDYLLYDKNSPEYVWDDSRGRHSVKVSVKFDMPRYRSYSKDLGFTRCVEVKHATGDVSVTVTRTDLDKSKGGSFWRWLNPARISYTAIASYSFKPYKDSMPKLKSIKKN